MLRTYKCRGTYRARGTPTARLAEHVETSARRLGPVPAATHLLSATGGAEGGGGGGVPGGQAN